MKYFYLSTLALGLAVSGCAEMQQKTGLDAKVVASVSGAAVGCVGGALLARATGQNGLGGCMAGAVVGGLLGFEKSRQDEIASAEKARQEAILALAPLSLSRLVRAGPVRTVEVTATDNKKNETRKFQAFESVSLEIPLTARGTPEYNAALSKLKMLAEKVADERGSSQIDVSLTAADAKANKVVLETASAQTSKGNTVTVSKTADNSISKGVERITVRAGKIQQTEVS